MNSFLHVLLLVVFFVCYLNATEMEVDGDGMASDTEFGGNTDSSSDIVSHSSAFAVEHSLGPDGSFVHRNSLKFSVGSDFSANVTRVPSDKPMFGEEEIENLKKLLAADGIYRIRVHSIPGDDTSPYVTSAIPACDLQKTGFKEELIFHLSVGDNVVGMSYSSAKTGHSAIARACNPTKVPSNLKIQTRYTVAEQGQGQTVPLIITGPKPPTLAHVNFNDGVDTAKPPAAEQSFLRKYWYVILPLVALTLGGGGAPAEEGKEGAAAPAGAAK
jgi:hypothetical protein